MFFFHICWREQRAVRISLHQCSTSSTAWLRCGWRRLSTPYLQPQRCSAQVRPGIKSAVKLRIGKAKLLGCCCKAVCLSVPVCRPRIPAGSQLCWENAGTDPGPAVQVVRGPSWSSARRSSEVWPPAGQTDGAANPPPQLPPPDKTAVWTLTVKMCKKFWKSSVFYVFTSIQRLICTNTVLEWF